MGPTTANALLLALTLGTVLLGMGQMYLTLIERFPETWVYWHSRVRKPGILSLVAMTGVVLLLHPAPTPWLAVLVFVQGLMLLMTYRLHQETMFCAVDFPECTAELGSLPIGSDEEVALIEVGEQARAYPLQYVIHHHIVNDEIGGRIISLTYCAMCRTVIAFDVTELGPLFVGSYKNANMVVADRKTKTFFQQASFASIAGPLHPRELEPYPCQILPWKDILELDPAPEVARVVERDFREFKLPLPIPGLWRRLMASDTTPGLRASSKDQRFPARTRVVGLVHEGRAYVVLKSDLDDRPVASFSAQELFLVSTGSTVSAFANRVGGTRIELELDVDGFLRDRGTGSRWDRRGHNVEGPLELPLSPRLVSDEYWFSWLRFHPESELLQPDQKS